MADIKLRSPFLELPAELRNRIYELSLTQDKIVMEWPDIAYTDASHLAATCRSVRNEFQPMLRQNTRLTADLLGGTTRDHIVMAIVSIPEKHVANIIKMDVTVPVSRGRVSCVLVEIDLSRPDQSLVKFTYAGTEGTRRKGRKQRQEAEGTDVGEDVAMNLITRQELGSILRPLCDETLERLVLTRGAIVEVLEYLRCCAMIMAN